jgi:hypothetical protein
MKTNKLNKLTLNQQTLRNLTNEELKTVAGGFMTGLKITCPECPTPPQTSLC